jgi:CubicO group peptidase (beta-lactamase class C family)
LHPASVFAVASVTKVFVAALVLALAEDGVLALDDGRPSERPGRS